MGDKSTDAETETGRKELFSVGTRGYYLSRKGPESPRHGARCEVIAYIGERLLLRFDDPTLGEDSAEPDQFYPRVYPAQTVTSDSSALFLGED